MAVLIGFIGKAGSGKDYAADVVTDLVSTYHVKKYKFADPLKSFCRKAFRWTEDHTDGDLKEVRCSRTGVIPRVAMQQLGAEWGRNLYSDIWVDYTLNKIWNDVNSTELERTKMGWLNRRVEVALITDVRFPNEAKALQEMGAYLVHMASAPSRNNRNTDLLRHLFGRVLRGINALGHIGFPHSMHSTETSVSDTAAFADVTIDNSARNEDHLRRELVDFLTGKVSLK